jgi:hypothetical protein
MCVLHLIGRDHQLAQTMRPDAINPIAVAAPAPQPEPAFNEMGTLRNHRKSWYEFFLTPIVAVGNYHGVASVVGMENGGSTVRCR